MKQLFIFLFLFAPLIHIVVSLLLQVPDFYTCGAEGFWRPTQDPTTQLVYPACAPASPAQRVFNINMQFPSSVICNAAGQNVLSERIRHVGISEGFVFISVSARTTDIHIKVEITVL